MHQEEKGKKEWYERQGAKEESWYNLVQAALAVQAEVLPGGDTMLGCACLGACLSSHLEKSQERKVWDKEQPKEAFGDHWS